MPVRRDVIESANDLLNFRRNFARAVRRGLSLGDSFYVPLRRLIKRCDAFDGVLTAHQRAVDHLGGHSKPNELKVQKDQAKSLRGINQTLTGIYDVMRLAVITTMIFIRFAHVTHTLIMFQAGLPPLDRPSPSHPLSENSSSSSDNEDFDPDFAGFGPHSSDDDDNDDHTIRPSPGSPPLPSESSLSSSSLETDSSGFDEDADDGGDEEGSG